jgi:hypothetical protein
MRLLRGPDPFGQRQFGIVDQGRWRRWRGVGGE